MAANPLDKRGAVILQKGRTRISIFIDNAVLFEFELKAVPAAGLGTSAIRHGLRRSSRPSRRAQQTQVASLERRIDVLDEVTAR